MKEKLDNFKSWWKWKIYYPWLDFKRGVKNLWFYRKIVWSMGDFDYAYILQMKKFQLERLLKVLENGFEVEESRNPKIEDIKRCIELITNKLEDNYAKRCGYNSERTTIGFSKIEGDGKLYQMINTHPNPQSDEELRDIFSRARELEMEEWNELWDIIKKGNKSDHGMLGWWD